MHCTSRCKRTCLSSLVIPLQIQHEPAERWCKPSGNDAQRALPRWSKLSVPGALHCVDEPATVSMVMAPVPKHACHKKWCALRISSELWVHCAELLTSHIPCSSHILHRHGQREVRTWRQSAVAQRCTSLSSALLCLLATRCALPVPASPSEERSSLKVFAARSAASTSATRADATQLSTSQTSSC